MCLILFAYEKHPQYRLVFAANRDEYYSRPAEPMHLWETEPDVLAGVDLQCGGTWMGITRTGRFAAITNYRDPASILKAAPSRGHLVGDFLSGSGSPEEYLNAILPMGPRYNGFNLFVGDPRGLYYYSNRADRVQAIGPGVFGLSNRLLDTPWPKVVKGRRRLAGLVEEGRGLNPETLFDLLADRVRPADRELPDTGVGLALERLLSPLFIHGDNYGTRCSTVVLWDRQGRVDVWERTFVPGGQAPKVGQSRHFTLSGVPSAG